MDVMESNPLEQQLQENSRDEPLAPQASNQPEGVKQELGSPPRSEEPCVTIKQELQPDVEVKQESQESSTQSTGTKPSANTATEEVNLVVKEEIKEEEHKEQEVPKMPLTNRLNTITTAIVREVIPVCQDDPSSPWDVDSNPTPELSRTPTPEPIPSFTPVMSASAGSVAADTQNIKAYESEDPMPPVLVAEGLVKKEDDGQVMKSIKDETGNVPT
ncbi:hypothetical protein ElyMa_001343800 [Elysia marginata]|uniref:Uncharacterized protein n=1 Tax=Elysia marginata TaxID=1093978 RepID=A0AAV4IM08_9GAST|nr:hypothetical protein ElyMa_001343800 [Elysia marginata]